MYTLRGWKEGEITYEPIHESRLDGIELLLAIVVTPLDPHLSDTPVMPERSANGGRKHRLGISGEQTREVFLTAPHD